MNVDTMRMVDKWLGVPLCFFLSCWNAIWRRMRKPGSGRPVRKILFIQLSEMGSAISAHSALRKAQALFPNAELHYLIFSEMQAGIRLLRVIPEKNVFCVPSTSLSGFLTGALRLILRVRRERMDAIIDMELFSRASAVFTCLLGAPIRVGFQPFAMEGLYRGSFYTHRVLYNHLHHISQNFLSLVYALQSGPSREPLSKRPVGESDIVLPRCTSSSEARRRIWDRVGEQYSELSHATRIVLLNPNGSDLLPLRRWPMERYAEVARRLLENPNVLVVVTGTASERSDAAFVCDAVQSPRCINFAGQTTLEELLDLYAVSALLVSNDSGPPNFATLTDIRVLVLFGPESPVCYKPLGDTVEVLYAGYHCSPCVSAYNHRKSCCTDNRCLKAITVDQVCDRIAALVPDLVGPTSGKNHGAETDQVQRL